MKRLYIIGPATGIEDDNRPAFEDARTKLRDAGYYVDIPHDFVPAGTSWEAAMLKSINVMSTPMFARTGSVPYYHGVVRLPGWEESRGAKVESMVALACGIPCKTVDEWLGVIE